MAAERINITLGTAGHIDHGKTALVKCLTGCETDRLKAEKERGMSIDLGFAPCTIANMEVGIVDVPGHENFVKTMVAGATGMDGVILVVAADDGVMPQTREHLDILTLLGIEHGLVVVTKIDRVEPDHLELAREEMEEFFQGTFLEGAPIFPLSNVTGEGFSPFLEGLDKLLHAIKPKPLDGLFRLPVDRAFSAKGHGTVIAGIPVCGSARVGDELDLLPLGTTGRIKGIEVYGQTSDVVKAGQCAALNVRHLEHRSIDRGHVIATPGFFSTHEWYTCKLRLLPLEKLLIKSGAKVKFHTGTSEMIAAVYPLQGNVLSAGQECIVQLRVETPLVAAPGDRFILRSLSPVRTVGGGMVIEDATRRLKRDRPEVIDDLQRRAEAIGDRRQWVEYCVRVAPEMAATERDVALRAKIPVEHAQAVVEELIAEKKISRLATGLLVHHDTAAGAQQRIVAAVGEFHRESPEIPGVTPEQLRQSTGLSKPVLEGMVAALKDDARLVDRDGRLALAEHQPKFREEDVELLEQIETLFRDAVFRPPGTDKLVEQAGGKATAVGRIVKILLENGRLIDVGENLIFHRDAIDQARQALVDHLQKEGRLESVQFKYLLDTSRKFAIPLLDYFDRVGVTRRQGNTRFPKTDRAEG